MLLISFASFEGFRPSAIFFGDSAAIFGGVGNFLSSCFGCYLALVNRYAARYDNFIKAEEKAGEKPFDPAASWWRS